MWRIHDRSALPRSDGLVSPVLEFLVFHDRGGTGYFSTLRVRSTPRFVLAFALMLYWLVARVAGKSSTIFVVLASGKSFVDSRIPAC